MKYGITLILSLLFSSIAFAQAPANDECSSAIDLGTPPNCDPGVFYTNVDATASTIGDFNLPSCFVNGVTPRDVWFSFTPSDTIEDYRITITGMAANGQPALTNPQIALYRGQCVENGLAELLCASSDPGSNEIRLDALQLTFGVTYYLRVNDFTATGTPNSGAFNVCIEQKPPINLVNEGGSQACSGTVYDTGGPDENYGDNEDHTYVICPNQPTNCINLGFTYYNVEYDGSGNTAGSDQIIVYDGADISAPVLATIGGGDFVENGVADGGATCFEVNAGSGCVTIQFISDDVSNLEGFEAVWTCSNIPCEEVTPLTVDLDVTAEDMAEAIRAAQTTLTVTNLDCPDGGFGIFNGDNTDLGLGQGIILSSGDADYAIGPNDSDGGGSFGSGGPGDADLDSLSVLFGDGTLSQDACILELDVFANTDELVFEYVFGSEEYPEFVNQFNDIFAFLISGPGITGEPALNNQRNIAVLPNPAQTVVQIDSVNNGFNYEFFRNNQIGQSVQYDGLTSGLLGAKKSLTARAEVEPCNTYHLKLAVADRGDNAYDSGVFVSDIRSGAPEATVNFVSGIDYLVEDCTNLADTLVISLFNNSDSSVTYDLNVLGTATPNEDYFILGLPDSITFEPGENEFTYPITVLSDLAEEGTEEIIINFVIDFGCGSTIVSSLVVELQDRLDVTINNEVDTAIFCINDGVGLTAEGAGTFAWTPAEIFDDPFSATVFATPPGSMEVQVVGALGNCTDTTTIFLREVDPMIEITTPDTINFCEGDTIQLTQTNNLEDSNLIWSPDFALIDSPDTPNPLISPFFNTEYRVSVTLEGCTVSDSVFVDVKELAIPTVIADTTLCESYPIQLAETPFFVQETDYEWTPAEVFDDPTDPEEVVSFSENTEFTLISTTTNGACADTQMVNVMIIPSRLEILNGDTLEVCAGYDPIVLSAQGTPTGGTTIDWYPDGGGLTPSTGNNYTVQPEITVNYYATYSVNNCPQIDSILVKVDSLPQDMEIEADPFKDPFCQGDTFFLRSPIFDVGDFPEITHMWFAAPGIQTGDSLYNAYVIAQDTSLFFRVATNGACVDTSEIQIDVITPPAFTLTPQDTTICAGGSVQYNFEFLDGSMGSLEWMPDDGSLSCTDCFDPVATPSGAIEYMIELTAEGSDCTFPLSARIGIQPPPRLTVATGPTICEGESVGLVLSAAEPGTTYVITGGGLNSNDPRVVVSPTTTTTYTITATNECAEVEETVTVSVIEDQDLSIVGLDKACEGDLLTFSAPTDVPEGTSEQYSWFVNGQFASSEAMFSIEAVRNVDVRLTYTNPCETIVLNTSVIVSPAPTIEVTNITSICLGESLNLALEVNAATTSYDWVGSDGFISNVPNPNVSPTSTTTYGVLATTGGGCKPVTKTFTIEVIQPYALTIDENQTVCNSAGTAVAAQVTPETAGTFEWTGDGIIGATDQASIEVNPEVTSTYTVTFTDADGCFDPSTAVSTVTVLEALPVPTVIASADTVFSGDQVTLTASGPPTGFTYTYDWETGSNADPMTGMGQEFTFTAPQDGGDITYTLTVTSDPGGCQESTAAVITVIRAEFEIPNLISPNRDGVNDGFRVFFNGNLGDYNLVIFNRWGQEVFQSNDPTQAWDGTRDGTDQAMDTYLYRVRFVQNGMTVEKDGEFQLIR